MTHDDKLCCGNKLTVAKRMADRLRKENGDEQILSVDDCRTLIGYFVSSVTSELFERSRVEIRGLGVFKINKVKSRKVRNPKTGEVFVQPESYRLSMKPSAVLRKAIRSIAHSPKTGGLDDVNHQPQID
jgi:nucleoid DNA-binding protein